MKNLIKTLSVATMISFLFAACQKDDNTTNAMATIDIEVVNVGFSAWKVVSVNNGTNVAILETNNTPFTFQKDRRYRIVSMANPSMHPFEFRDAGNAVLISQSSGSMGSLEGNASIQFVRDANSISFTTSSAFTAAVSTYNCANHNGMRGTVIIQ